MPAIKMCGEWAFNFIISLTLDLKQETCQLHAVTALTTEERTTPLFTKLDNGCNSGPVWMVW